MTKQGSLILYRKKSKTNVRIQEVNLIEIYDMDNTSSMNIITSNNKKLVITYYDKSIIDDITKAIQLLRFSKKRNEIPVHKIDGSNPSANKLCCRTSQFG